MPTQSLEMPDMSIDIVVILEKNHSIQKKSFKILTTYAIISLFTKLLLYQSSRISSSISVKRKKPGHFPDT